MCSYVFMYWSDWSFDGPILQRRSACSFGFDSGVGCISVDNVVGALKDLFISVGSVDESGAHAEYLPEALELEGA